MPEESEPHSPEAVAAALNHLIMNVGSLADTLIKVRAENVVLTATLAQVLTHLAATHPKPHDLVGSLTSAAKVFADRKLADLHEHPAAIEGAYESLETLRSFATAGADAIVETRKELRRWWLPATWRW